MDNNSTNEFSSIKIGLASPERIREWSYGEVTKPETTQKCVKDMRMTLRQEWAQRLSKSFCRILMFLL